MVQVSPASQQSRPPQSAPEGQQLSDAGLQPVAQHFSLASQQPLGSAGQEEPPAVQHCVLGTHPSPGQHFSFSSQHHLPSQTVLSAPTVSQQPSNSVHTSTIDLQHPL